MFQILIVENDKSSVDILRNYLKDKITNIKCNISNSIDDVKKLLKEKNYDLVLVDFNLKDTKEIIDFLISKQQKIIIFGVKKSKDIEEIDQKKIVDYILNCDVKNSLNFFKNNIQRLEFTKDLNLLVASEFKETLEKIKSYLIPFDINVYELKDKNNMLEVIENKNIDIVLIDYTKEDDLKILLDIRKKYTLEELPVIVLSSMQNSQIISRFLKLGANDYIKKPFTNEEFKCRLNLIIDNMMYIRKIKEISITDHLTKTYNRKFLYEMGEKIFLNAKRNSLPICVAVFDIDDFKQINDTFGHIVGDEVLKTFAKTLKDNFRKSDLIARYGGEEFVVILPGVTIENANKTLEKVRKKIEALNIKPNIKITTSIGLNDNGETLDEFIEKADKQLYKAKKSGKNKICSENL